jgi:hypothetical protein
MATTYNQNWFQAANNVYGREAPRPRRLPRPPTLPDVELVPQRVRPPAPAPIHAPTAPVYEILYWLTKRKYKTYPLRIGFQSVLSFLRFTKIGDSSFAESGENFHIRAMGWQSCIGQLIWVGVKCIPHEAKQILPRRTPSRVTRFGIDWHIFR